MKLLKYFFSVLFLLFITNLFAQKLSLNELHTMAGFKNWETTNKLLLGKGWDYYDSSESDGEGYNTISWAFGRNVYDNSRANGWFYVFNYEGLPNKIMYRFRQREYYNAIIQQIFPNGYKLSSEDILDNRVVASYENKAFYLKIAYNREEDSTDDDDDDYYYSSSNKKTYTVYEVTIYKKGGVYDPNNGIKKEYDDYGNLSTIYNLKDGKIDGLLTDYDSIGRIKRTVHFKSGNLDGSSIEKFYFDNNEDYYTFYGNFKSDQREGKWVGEIITPTSKNVVQEFFYSNGKKEGLNKETKDDFIMFKNYKNDVLDGKTYEYINIDRLLIGGYQTLDTINKNVKLFSILEYKDNLLNGNSKYFDITGSIKAEGAYKDSLKTGLWKYYHDNISDENNIPLEYSKKLYREANYLNGKLHGIQKRYSSLEKINIPCENNEEEECYKTECVYINETANYENDELNGPYELRGKSNQLWLKGNYLNDKETGNWKIYGDSFYSLWINKDSFETGNYIDGKKQGKWERFENNELLERYNYIDDVINGEHITYIMGKPSEKKYFNNGLFYKLECLDDAGNIKKTYTIRNVTSTKYDCTTTETLAGGVFTKNYSFLRNNDFQISSISFQIDFEGSDEKIKKLNGFFEHKLLDGKVLTSGNYNSDTKTGDWNYYFYDQNVKLTYSYDGYGILKNEYYYDLKNNEPFSGEYIHKSENGFYEERKVKDGLRNGVTRFKDSNDKTIKKESYKDGILKE
ncbi:hypothetical protein [Flavobacterium sp.]|jgi:antitoxin component YwqK of YwqJK toxin-antitoxin module|uniref:hypothetical protein n=1 Tax=Flavobacterium sp. TaxID=239 RepID=UPI0037BF5059